MNILGTPSFRESSIICSVKVKHIESLLMRKHACLIKYPPIARSLKLSNLRVSKIYVCLTTSFNHQDKE